MSRPWEEDYYDDSYTCTTCDRYFANWDRLLQHLENSNSHAFCSPCQLDYHTRNALTSHWANSRRHSFCVTCSTLFDDDDDLEDHRDAEHPVCSDCNIRFQNDRGLHEHNRQKHDARYCISCRRLFQSSHHLNTHLNSSIHKPKDFVCPMARCNFAAVSASAIVLHMESGRCGSGINRSMIDRYVAQHDTSRVITDPRRMITSGLGSSRYNPPPTYIATQAAFNGWSYECYFCHCEFRTLPQLNQHLASPKHSRADQNLYRCPNGNCHSTFSTLSGLCQHMERETCGANRFKNTVRGLMSGMGRLAISLY